MIKTAIRRAAESERPICVNLEPKTRDDAISNLNAFTEECRDQDPHPDRTPLDLDVQITQCFGWLQLPRNDVLAAINRIWNRSQAYGLQRAQDDLDDSESCFAIVYEYVGEGELDPDIVQRHLDFFYLAGFVLVPWREENWCGKGVLVDFSDLVPPHSRRWWRSDDFRKMSIGWIFIEQQERCVQEIEHRVSFCS